ncbi:MAG: leucine-rich repeat protein [Eubacteriales bacterium]|nr:leucine-rich repeat protein [Eubacteriales bacterium]
MFKRGLSIALAAILMLSSIVVAGAQTTNNSSPYKDYELPIITRKIENNIPVYYDGNGEKVDITKYNRSIRTYSDLPQSYDLRDENRVTSVKDQGSEGLCWDFGATAALESNILSQPEFVSQLPENAWETLDLSEAGIYTNLEDKDSVLYNSYYNDPKKGSGGGFADDVAMGLSSGYGLYPEELLPYENWSNGYNESEITIPHEIGGLEVEAIADDFEFYGENPITGITFSGGFKSVGSLAFISMRELETVVFEEGIQSIGPETFSNCQALKNVSFPDSLKNINSGAFSSCISLENVEFPENLQLIGDNAFANCMSLKDIQFGDKLEYVGNGAFRGISATCVVFGKNIKNIGKEGLGYTIQHSINFKPVSMPQFKVYGYPETGAQKYAERNGFEFIDISNGKPEITDEGFDYSVFLQGDIDLNGKVTVLDATLIQLWVADRIELNDIQLCNGIVCDIYNDVNIMSATYIQRYVAKIIPDFSGGAMG